MMHIAHAEFDYYGMTVQLVLVNSDLFLTLITPTDVFTFLVTLK
jgi:hypothetical protein